MQNATIFHFAFAGSFEELKLEEQFHTEISNRFADHDSRSFAGLPPFARIITSVRDGNDSDGTFAS